ncbi:hypothetical protein ACQJBY_061092 [Aegilops geniculata]
MEQFTTLLPYYRFGLCLLCALLLYAVLRAVLGGAKHKRPARGLPPGPWQLPVIGSLHHLLGGLPHRTMRDLSLRYGPLMLQLLRVCERVVVVVSSAEAVRDITKGHDVAFSERLSGPGVDELTRHGQGIMFAPYGDHWRLIRRIITTELVSARRVRSFGRIREEEAARLVSSLRPATPGAGRQLVNIAERLDEFVLESVVRAIYGDKLPERAAFHKLVRQGVELSSLFDLRDLFPSSWLVRLLPRRRGKAARSRREMSRLMESILRTHEKRRSARVADGDDERDMVDVLLRIQKEADMPISITHGVIRKVLKDVFGAGLDTIMVTLRWTMTELMANPRVMQKAQSEIRHVLAGQARVHEAALNGLHYLRAVIKETLRLHPPGPLVPRMCLQDSKIQGHVVPQGAIVFTNVWAISRDPKYWNEPEKFMPERFEADGVADFRGTNFEFTPFGVGRRICPGIGFANANIEIALASLLYHYEWELPAGVKPEEVDMTEVFGATVTKKADLYLHPVPRFPL